MEIKLSVVSVTANTTTVSANVTTLDGKNQWAKDSILGYSTGVHLFCYTDSTVGQFLHVTTI